MKKNFVMFLSLLAFVSCGVIGTVEENGETVPFGRKQKSYKRMSDKGTFVSGETFINMRDYSDEIIVYSDLNDAPAKHCKRKKGESILRVNDVTGEVERICRLDTPGSRVEGSRLEVDEIDYFAMNSEYKDLKNIIDDEEIKLYYSNSDKYYRPDKIEVVRRHYLEPKDQVQRELRSLYNRKFNEQYGN